MRVSTILFALAAVAFASAQQPAYTCDPNQCKLPTCQCASKNPPAGIQPANAPQFLTFTFDDSIQENLMKTAYTLLNRKNPNGCPARGTWFVSIQYTDMELVTQWYGAGHEVADHTYTHVGSPSEQEISSCKQILNSFAGIPKSKLAGFRAPFLNYTADTLANVAKLGFAYDSSSTAQVEDAYWPYTLDNGMANDCWTGICDPGKVKLPGLWEIPMHAIVDAPQKPPHLMDPYLDLPPDQMLQLMKDNFNRHYNGGRQPFGIYVHPVHLTAGAEPRDTAPLVNMLTQFLEWAMGQPDVWMVNNQQLLEWMRNPVPKDQLASQPYMKCDVPKLGKEICNGLDDNGDGQIDEGVVESCSFPTGTFRTCYGCPGQYPTLEQPLPPRVNANRKPLPDNCDTLFWDSTTGQCLPGGALMVSNATTPAAANPSTSLGTLSGPNKVTPSGASSSATIVKSGVAMLLVSTLMGLLMA
ncbi:uncharacterized protein VTP21DRAFT_1755 [Calcarisporiella thermophila]|uniref:uncharacterized protein n=1 Tax=Calcarisporiella thermophila TaxID=911321 RepID=UPI0037435600